MQNKADDELIDYNDLEEEKENGSGQHTSYSPVQTSPSLKTDNSEGEIDDEDESDPEKGQEIEMDSSSAQQALVERMSEG